MITVVKISLGITAGIGIIGFILSLLMLLGVYQQKEKYLKINIILSVILFVLSCVYHLIKFFVAISHGAYGAAFGGLIGKALSLCKYFISVTPNLLIISSSLNRFRKDCVEVYSILFCGILFSLKLF